MWRPVEKKLRRRIVKEGVPSMKWLLDRNEDRQSLWVIKLLFASTRKAKGRLMWSHEDRPFKEVDEIKVAAEFILAAERLIARDVKPELLPESDRATLKYYLECLSKKFSGSQARADI
jgi:hypothetical protein